MSLAKEMDRWWGMDEDQYLDDEGNQISKEDYEKQFTPPPEQPLFGDPTQLKPTPFDPNNPLMYMGSGRRPVQMKQPAYYKEHRDIVNLLENTGRSLLKEAGDQKKEATATAKKLGAPNPFYHLRGGDAGDLWADLGKKFLIQQGIIPPKKEPTPEDYAVDALSWAGKQLWDTGKKLFGDGVSPFYHLQGGMEEQTVLGSGKGKTVLPPQDDLESKKENPMVEEVIEEPMDDGDIRSYFPNAKILRYSSLSKMSSIEQLLPKDKSYAFLLYEDSPGSGHWVAVMRYGKTIEFFCSYGSKIDGPLRWYNPKDNAMLGQSKPYLSLLLKKAEKKFEAIHNPVAFQSSKHGVATCGAWDVMRVNQLVNHNQDLREFADYMEQIKKETGLTYDEIVANYVSKR